ncbi:dTDP-4-amino-4,6-dideoxygalactose transaminase [Vibrio lentus]
MIKFNIRPYLASVDEHVLKSIQSDKICGDGYYTKKCQAWFEKHTKSEKTLMTPSCTAALELAALLIDISPGDEVIMPSYTFVSTANAFVLRGAKIIFVDVKPETMNINENLIEEAITEKTKAIVPVHYAGVPCEMNKIMEIADKYDLFVIEDAAQGMMSTYNGRALGTIGHLGTYSFHETKNYTSAGEGGLLLINDKRFISNAEIFREKGTNRSQFLLGQVDKYTWNNLGSSFLPGDVQAAYLYALIIEANLINDRRLEIWNEYDVGLKTLEDKGYLSLQKIPSNCTHNAHMFYMILNSHEERNALIKYLLEREINSSFHYIPLHSSPGGERFGAFCGEDIYTTSLSEKLIRLPLYYGLSKDDVTLVIKSIIDFFMKSK